MNKPRTISQTIEPQNAIECAEKILALQKERQPVRPEEDLDRVRSLERQIQSVDEEIDQRVYALYGLSEEEVKVVEGS